MQTYTEECILLQGSYRYTNHFVYTDFVSQTVETYQTFTCARSVTAEESLLSKPLLSIIYELRSRYCSSLNIIQDKTGRVMRDYCPSCNLSHLITALQLSYPSYSTHLWVQELWIRPRLAPSIILFLPLLNLPDLRLSPSDSSLVKKIFR